jgi:extradiol dioxygenase family protein
MQPFHLAFPTTDLAATRAFFVDTLGVGIGRESDAWVDFDFFGHQVTAHFDTTAAKAATNPVDGKKVPTFHFGIVLLWSDWEKLAARLRERGVAFVIEPYIRFAGEVGEQGTFFLYEPGGAALEFKTFKDMSALFRAA